MAVRLLDSWALTLAAAAEICDPRKSNPGWARATWVLYGARSGKSCLSFVSTGNELG